MEFKKELEKVENSKKILEEYNKKNSKLEVKKKKTITDYFS